MLLAGTPTTAKTIPVVVGGDANNGRPYQFPNLIRHFGHAAFPKIKAAGIFSTLVFFYVFLDEFLA